MRCHKWGSANLQTEMVSIVFQKALLEDILTTECLSSFAYIVSSLFLNKVKCRLGHLDMNLFAADSALYGSLISVQRAAAELKIEFLEELSATVSLVEQITDRVYMCRFKASSFNILAISAF